MAGVKTVCSAPQVGKWKKRLPPILEVDCEEVLDAPVEQILLNCPMTTLADVGNPSLLAESHDNAEVFIKRLKDAGRPERSNIVAWVAKALPTLAMSEIGSRVVQAVLEVATGVDRKTVVSEFRGMVYSQCLSPYGHEVLVRLIENMPTQDIEFMAKEMRGRSIEIAKDRFGSRVLESLSMHCSADQLVALEDELVKETFQLACHPNGSSVLKHFIEYGSPEYKIGIVRCLLPNMILLTMHRIASHVIEKALTHCESSDSHMMVQALLQAAKPIPLEDIACSWRGSCVLAEIAHSGLCTSELRLRLSKSCARLSRSKFGRRVIESFELIPPICTEVGSHGGFCVAALAA
jgi:hypothetical protein